jgi:hypothetical protein
MYGGSSYDYWDVYLTVFDVTINTFIPDNHYPNPLNPSDTGEGDDRGYARWGSSRTKQTMAIYGPHKAGSLFADGPYHVPGETALYDVATSVDGSNRLTAAARNDWVWGAPMKKAWGTPSGHTLSCSVSKNSYEHLELQCHGNEATPLFGWAPGITYDFYIDFWVANDFSNSLTIDYLVQGQHDGFPNYEIFVGDQQIFDFDYRNYGQSIWSLGPPAEYGGYFITGSVQ